MRHQDLNEEGTSTEVPSSLCAECSAESARWLDTRPSTLIPRMGFAYGSGAAYDASAAGIADNRAAHHEQWVATVRYQRALIVAGCRAGRHGNRAQYR